MDPEPLSGTDIRIIHLLPNTDPKAEMQCELLRVPLEYESYCALSYVWGSPTPTKEVSMNGKKIYITPNLFAALRHIRHETEAVDLWVDALCINQDDNAEKSRQVSRMAEIYAEADPVLMWLGEEEDDSDLAMDLIQRIGDTTKSVASAEDPDLHREVAKRWRDTFTSESLDRHWTALERLFLRPYWTRVWIVQEVVSNYVAQICCGSARAHWQPLMGILSASQALSSKELSSGLRQLLMGGALLQLPLARTHARLMTGTKLSLLDGLLLIRGREATDPKDYVYSILSLVTSQGLEPDYNKTLLTVYQDVVKYLIEQDRNLHILSVCKTTRTGELSKRMTVVSSMRQLAETVKRIVCDVDKLTAKDPNEVEEAMDKDLEISLADGPEAVSSREIKDRKEYHDEKREVLLAAMPETVTALNNEKDHAGDESYHVAENLQAISSEEVDEDHDQIETRSKLDILDARSSENTKKDDDMNAAASTSEALTGNSVTETKKYNNGNAGSSDHQPLGLRNINLGIEDPARNAAKDLMGSTVQAYNKIQEMYFPSWVPDWREATQHAFYLAFKNPEMCHYKASGNTKPSVQFPEEEWLMMVDGARIDVIKTVSPSKQSGQRIFGSTFREEWKLWTEGNHPRDVYGNQTQQQEAFLHTFVTSRNRDGTKGTSGLTMASLNSTFGSGWLSDETHESDASLDQIWLNDFDYMSIFPMICFFRFSITIQGFMGRVPRGTQPGDIIAIFFGGKVPYVLRKYENEDKYFLIGECYIHGIMEGEMMDEIGTNKAIETFILM